ncbi:MAG: hypothetical protein KGL39_58930 [Patescibacteria group bacterium]|nr:hypothetical protein [Patescibacteria group bacterium]
MSAPLLISYRDAIDQCGDWTGGTAQAATQRDIRACIQRAYLNLLKGRKWRSLNRVERIVTQAPFNTGTVQYFSASNTLVLSGATWPTWANQGSVLINNVISDILSVNNDLVTANLDPNVKPDGDIAAGTSFQLFQDQYVLPPDFHLADMPIAEGFLRFAQYIEPQQWMTMRRIRMSSGTPCYWTVMPSTRYLGTMVICLSPWPNEVLSEDMVYTGRGRPLKYTGYGSLDTGTFNGTANSNIVTAVTGTFSSDMVGSLFRTRLDSKTPDGIFGLNQYAEQRVIAGFTDATHITLDANLANTYSANAYVVSDPIDVPPHLIEPVITLAQYQLALQRKMPPEEVAKAKAAHDAALLEAQNSDAPVSQRRSAWDTGIWPRRIARFPYSNVDNG